MDRLELIATFVAVAEAGSFTAAATKSGRSASAMSRGVAALEEQIGQRLFNRTTRALSLTEAGQNFVARARKILSDYEELTDSRQNDAPPRGLLTVTAPVMFGRLHIMPVLRDFLRRHAGVDARLLLFDRVVSLVDESVDVGCRIGVLADSSLIAQKVGVVRRVLVAAPSYLAEAGAPQRPEDLVAHRFISSLSAATGSSSGSSAGSWRFGADEDVSVRLRPRLAVNSVDAALDAAIAGFGVARLYSYQVAQAVAEGRLTRLLTAFEPEPVPIHLVRPPGRPPRKTALFVEAAAAALRKKFPVA